MVQVNHDAGYDAPRNGAPNQQPLPGSPTADVIPLLAEAALGRYDRIVASTWDTQHGNPEIRNIRGVCLMRLSQHQQAILLYRELLLNASGVTLRPDRPLHFKQNFATALLLGGHPAGCLEVLHECDDRESPIALRLKAAIERWEKKLPFWARLDWACFRNEPSGRGVQLDFEPGDFGYALPVADAASQPPHTDAVDASPPPRISNQDLNNQRQ